MHIPDGFISPKVYLPAYGAAAVLWAHGLRRARRVLDEETIPRLAVLTALAFVLMMIVVPIPGGTTAHFTGVALLAVVFGVWVAFLSLSMVLLLQALLVGVGGVTTLPVNALAVGFVGSVTAAGVYAALKRVHATAGLFVAGWASVVVPAVVIAVVLGIQPTIAHDAAGRPLFFPFGLSVTLPAVVLPHALVGIGEGIVTVFAYRLVDRMAGRAS
jgi:cobalt/nickel transport system permease protein